MITFTNKGQEKKTGVATICTRLRQTALCSDHVCVQCMMMLLIVTIGQKEIMSMMPNISLDQLIVQIINRIQAEQSL